MRVFFEDGSEFFNLLLTENFSNWVMRTIQDQSSCLRVDSFLKTFKIDIPFIILIRNDTILLNFG